jgi:hypothetical protein
LFAVQPFLGVPPRLQVPLGEVGGQSAGELQVFEIEWAHTLTLTQLPPGLVHRRFVYLHVPSASHGLLLLQAAPVAEQLLLVCSAHSESFEQFAVVTVQLMSVTVWVPEDVWVLVDVWVSVPVGVPVAVLVLVAVWVVDAVLVPVEVWVSVPVCVVVVVGVPVAVLVPVPVWVPVAVVVPV